MSTESTSPRGKHLVGKTYLIFVNQPLALGRIIFGQEDYVQFDSVVLRERIEDRDPIRSDDLGDNDNSAAHATHSR